MPTVKCNVANCTYWGEGNNCVADAILVEIDKHANNRYDMEASGDLSGDANHKDNADKPAETCCHTFKRKQ
ncbi:DUF1540 domain-containing protein [Fictibacillus sp. WQ 8-8]|uniref:DUF1540 domain-containing protein n=1 Tax=unclassified Fictibacillus TaxID=2644029 RepID=UPI0006A785BB|nr:MULTISPECIES: DUF1540 domain-containing protein [unclassified Fictibacillus]MCQ6266241.1 DUF1540 domain-containing protein [Fictibacillus sp. WQ 8-8]MED2972539.1 DUF1540 domain-containing protein [Fictibacillus sp. B-59209]SFD68346.1 protein of unknown function [Bacillus sp. OV194]